QRPPLGSADGTDGLRNKMWSGCHAHARPSRRVAHLAAARRYRTDGQARTPGMGGSGRAGRHTPRTDRTRPRLLLRKKFGAELSSAGSLPGAAIPGLSSGRRHLEKILPRPHAGKKWKRRRPSRPPLREPRRPHRPDPQRRAYPAHARRKGGRRSSASDGHDPGGSLTILKIPSPNPAESSPAPHSPTQPASFPESAPSRSAIPQHESARRKT